MKAVLLLHGFLSDEEDFSPLIPYLGKYYKKVELLTFPGHGIKFGKDKFTKEKVFTYLEEAFLQLQKTYQEIDIIGFSMGGALALYLANKFNVKRLILLAPAYRYINIIAPFVKAKMYFKIIHQIAKNKKIKPEQALKLQKKLSNILADDKASFRLGTKIFLKRVLPYYFAEFIKIIKKVTNTVTSFPNQTLLLWGKLDQIIPYSSVDEVYHLCTNPQKKLIIYDDITHLMLLSADNQKIINDIISFIEESKDYD